MTSQRASLWIRWLLVIGWTAFIYAFIPLARTFQEFVAERWGRELFTWVVLTAVGGAFGATLIRWGMALGRIPRNRAICLSAVALVFVAWTLHLAERSPEEALHFVQYGVLAMLLFRAVGLSVTDPSIYLAVWLIGSILGTVDELIQWVVPRRHFDLRDIGLNAGSCGLLLVAIGGGIQPRFIRGPVQAGSWGRLFVLGSLLWVMLFGCLLNTPAVQAAAEQRLPFLAGWLRYTTAMTEYGYRMGDPETGWFKSRFSPEALRETDAARAAEAAPLLDANHEASPQAYAAFLRTYSEVTDPFLHEMRVHLNRRDHYRYKAARLAAKGDEGEARFHATVAYREHRILRGWFGATLSRSVFDLRPATVAALASAQDPGQPYLSPVSRKLITRWSRGQILGGCGAVWLAWALACGYGYRRAVRRGPLRAAGAGAGAARE